MAFGVCCWAWDILLWVAPCTLVIQEGGIQITDFFFPFFFISSIIIIIIIIIVPTILGKEHTILRREKEMLTMTV